jgi:hypothetical protein
VGTIEHRLYASFPADQFRRGIAIYGKEKEYMKGYKEPGFQDRAAASARAKMKSAPKPDEAQLAARAERQAKREAKAAAKRAAKEEAQRLEQEQAIEAKNEQARAEAEVPVLTEADRKAARDARYAARKKRKK